MAFLSRHDRIIKRFRMRRVFPVLALLLIGVLFVASSNPAYAISTFSTRVVIQLIIEGGPVPEIIQVVDLTESDLSEAGDTGFPSFTNIEKSAEYDPDTRTLTVEILTNGAANYAGGIDRAIANAMGRVAGSLGLVNPSEFGFFLDVRVTGYIEVAGWLSNLAEYAETFYSIQVVGDLLEGIPEDGELLPGEWISTRDDPPLGSYDFIIDTTFLGIDETFSVLIPPSVSVESGSDVTFRIYSLGVFGHAGGAAASHVFGSTIVAIEDDDLPERPEEVSPEETPSHINVRLDVKPGSRKNCINLNGRGTIKAAILGGPEIDVTQIDPPSLELSGLPVAMRKAGPHYAGRFGKNTHKLDDFKCAVRDVGGDTGRNGKQRPDGWPDLVCRFIDDPQVWAPVSENIAVITGRLKDGTTLSGGDTFRTRPCRK